MTNLINEARLFIGEQHRNYDHTPPGDLLIRLANELERHRALVRDVQDQLDASARILDGCLPVANLRMVLERHGFGDGA